MIATVTRTMVRQAIRVPASSPFIFCLIAQIVGDAAGPIVPNQVLHLWATSHPYDLTKKPRPTRLFRVSCGGESVFRDLDEPASHALLSRRHLPTATLPVACAFRRHRSAAIWRSAYQNVVLLCSTYWDFLEEDLRGAHWEGR
jgi:hypothetical protein